MSQTKEILPPEALAIVSKLGLKRAYEGPYLRQVYQSVGTGEVRPGATSAYGLVTKACPSLLHRLDCDELWHFYAGSTLCLYLFQEGGLVVARLGNDLSKDEKPLLVVPKGTIFGAAVEGELDWCLFGCTCVPGFAAERCEFIKAESEELRQFVRYKGIIEELTAFGD